jgi:hypothetical protein
MLRYIFGLLLLAMGLHTTWQALRAGPLVLGYGHGHSINIPKPKWYHRGLWLCVGLVFLIGAVVFFVGSGQSRDWRVDWDGTKCMGIVHILSRQHYGRTSTLFEEFV